MRLLILLFFSFQVEAKEVLIKHRNLVYKISYSESAINYEGPAVKLSLLKQDCNQHIIKKTYEVLNSALAGDFDSKENSDSYTIEIDKQKKYDNLYTKRGLFFANFHDYFRQLKTEEMLNCKKN